MKFLVVGSGSIGQRHLRNLHALGYTALSVLRSRKVDVKEIEPQFGVVSFFNINDALAESPDVVIIANPTAYHIQPAINAARAGCDLFIEKPLSHSWDQVDDLMSLVTKKGLVALVAYNLRFHAGLNRVHNLVSQGEIGQPLFARAEVGSYLPDWRPDRDYRTVYSGRADQGGGVLLDLSHDLDYLLWFFGPAQAVTASMSKVSDLAIDVEDTVDMFIEHGDGVFSSLHLDYLQRAPARHCKIVGSEGTLVWDYIANTVEIFRAQSHQWETFHFDDDNNDMYLAELRHFIGCVQERKRPRVSLEDGMLVLKVALAAKAAAKTGQRQVIHDALE